MCLGRYSGRCSFGARHGDSLHTGSHFSCDDTTCEMDVIFFPGKCITRSTHYTYCIAHSWKWHNASCACLRRCLGSGMRSGVRFKRFPNQQYINNRLYKAGLNPSHPFPLEELFSAALLPHTASGLSYLITAGGLAACATWSSLYGQLSIGWRVWKIFS